MFRCFELKLIPSCRTLPGYIIYGTCGITRGVFSPPSSAEAEVGVRIAATIEAEPQLLEPVLRRISEQSEQRDNQDWSRLLGIDVRIENPPAWFPTAEVAAEIRCQHPDLQPVSKYENDGNGTISASSPLNSSISTLAPDS